MSLRPSRRSLPRMAAHALHGQHDSRDLTERTQAAGPNSLEHWSAAIADLRARDAE